MNVKTRIKALFNSDMYHGWTKKQKYFEGWYYKLVSQDEKSAIAIIPGVAMDERGNKHAFIQVLNGKELKASYYQFPFEDFKASKDDFNTSIALNTFTSKHIKLDHDNISGDLYFTEMIPWPSSILSPGIMGPFSFFPFMECYHGIVSMDHLIQGELTIEGKHYDFTNGRGYIEKDWGHSFPTAYFWMQSNHFSEEGISVKASVAKIPWMGTSFVGFIAGVWLKDRLIQFTTYNLSKLSKSFADEKNLDITIENKNYKLTIKAERQSSTTLASPIGGFMDGRINESMTDIMRVELLDKKQNKLILNDVGRNAGLEVAGDIKQIMK